MSIKKAYVEIVELLEANANKKVSSILPEILALVESKGGKANTIARHEDGTVKAIFCYYHKKWELVDECEYGAKKSTSSGLNTMCKEGVSQWTKQQRLAKKANEELLERLASEELSVSDLPNERIAIDEAKNQVVPRQDGHGFDEIPS